MATARVAEAGWAGRGGQQPGLGAAVRTLMFTLSGRGVTVGFEQRTDQIWLRFWKNLSCCSEQTGEYRKRRSRLGSKLFKTTFLFSWGHGRWSLRMLLFLHQGRDPVAFDSFPCRNHSLWMVLCIGMVLRLFFWIPPNFCLACWMTPAPVSAIGCHNVPWGSHRLDSCSLTDSQGHRQALCLMTHPLPPQATLARLDEFSFPQETQFCRSFSQATWSSCLYHAHGCTAFHLLTHYQLAMIHFSLLRSVPKPRVNVLIDHVTI